jgi:hypothetical protein
MIICGDAQQRPSDASQIPLSPPHIGRCPSAPVPTIGLLVRLALRRRPSRVSMPPRRCTSVLARCRIFGRDAARSSSQPRLRVLVEPSLDLFVGHRIALVDDLVFD